MTKLSCIISTFIDDAKILAICHHEISMIINQIDTAVDLQNIPILNWVKSSNLFLIREEDESTKQYFPVSLGQF